MITGDNHLNEGISHFDEFPFNFSVTMKRDMLCLSSTDSTKGNTHDLA